MYDADLTNANLTNTIFNLNSGISIKYFNDIYLKGKYILTAVNKNGFLRSQTSRPYSNVKLINNSNKIILIFNDNGLSSSNVNPDYFYPGFTIESISMGYKINTTKYEGYVSNMGIANITNNLFLDQSNHNVIKCKWEGIMSGLNVSVTRSFVYDQKIMKIFVTFMNNTGGDLSDLRFMQIYDPDNNFHLNGSYATINNVLYNNFSTEKQSSNIGNES